MEQVSQIGDAGRSKMSERLYYSLKQTTAGFFQNRNLLVTKSDTTRYTSSSIVKFNITQRGLMDATNSYISFDWHVDGSDGHSTDTVDGLLLSRVGCRGSLAKIIKGVKIYSFDGQTLEDCQDVGSWIHHLEKNVYSKDYLGSFATLEGCRAPEPTSVLTDGSLAASDGYVCTLGNDPQKLNMATFDFAKRMARATNYVIPLGLIFPFFNTSKLIPLSQCGNLVLELTLENPKNVLQYHKLEAADPGNASNNFNPDYVLEKVQLTCDVVRPSDVISETLSRLAAAGTMSLPYSALYINTVSGVQEGGSYQMSFPAYSVKSIFVLPRISANFMNLNADSYQSVDTDDVKAYSFLHSSTQYPSIPLDSAGKYMANQLRAFNRYNNLMFSNSYSIIDYSKGGFLASMEAEKDPSSDSSGISTKAGAQVQVDVSFNSTATRKSLTWFCVYEKVIQVMANQTVKIEL